MQEAWIGFCDMVAWMSSDFWRCQGAGSRFRSRGYGEVAKIKMLNRG